MLKKIHHIAYIVSDLDKAVELYENVFQVSVHQRQFFAPRGIEVALFYVGEVLFELIQPVEEGTRAYRYLQEHGEGFFHIAFEVDGIEERLKELEEKGIELIHKNPVPGIDWDVAWMKRESTLGVYSQLVRVHGKEGKFDERNQKAAGNAGQNC
jgi:methylmalonyl-CoA/ethylmalonyl-CoA epimerase